MAYANGFSKRYHQYRKEHKKKFGTCGILQFEGASGGGCQIKADYCETNCPQWNDGS